MKKLWLTAAATLTVLTTAAAQAGEADRPYAVALSGRIIDGSGAAPIPEGRVVAIDGVITCVGRADDCPAPPGAVFIDAGEGSIMPGLIDLHAHPRPHYYGWFLASGVTTVRSANTDLAMVRALQALPAPQTRLIWAGPMLDGDNSIIKRFYPEAEPGERLAQLGGRIGAGSDTPAGAYNLPGGGLHLEMELMTRAGLSPLQALSSATGTAADILQREDIGRIAVGRRADLLVVGGDPSQDIRDTRRLRQIILDGRILDPAAMQRRALDDGETLLAALMAKQGD